MRYGKLESLRGLAAILVVLYHSPYHWGSESTALIHNSYLFVDLFFVLSGFVMSLAYGQRIGHQLSASDYLILRLGRLYPLHLISLLLCASFILIKANQEALFGIPGSITLDSDDGWRFLANLLMLQSVGVLDSLSWNTPSWSISAELVAYILFFVLCLSLDRQRGRTLPLLISALGYGWLIALERPNLDITYDYGAVRCVAAFYLGVWLHRSNEASWWQQLVTLRINVLEWFTLVSLLVSVTLAETAPLAWIGAIASFVLAIAVFSAEPSGVLGRLLLSPPLQACGRWSYSVYLLHYLVILVFVNAVALAPMAKTQTGFAAMGLNLLILAATLICSAAGYRWFECPGRDLSKRWVKQRNSQPKVRLSKSESLSRVESKRG